MPPLAESWRGGAEPIDMRCQASHRRVAFRRPRVRPRRASRFAVPDVRAAVAELRQRGVVFEEYDEPALKTIDGVASINSHDSAWFKDSEGDFIERIVLD